MFLKYKTNPKPKDVILFKFPNKKNNKETREKWINIVSKLREDNWRVSDNSRICSQHFRPKDYGRQSEDKRKRTIGPRKLDRKLKLTAYTSIFPKFPLYMQTCPPNERSDRTSIEQRRESRQRYLRRVRT